MRAVNIAAGIHTSGSIRLTRIGFGVAPKQDCNRNEIFISHVAVTKVCDRTDTLASPRRERATRPCKRTNPAQSSFAFFLRTKAYVRVDRLRGKFRSLLLASVKHFLSDNGSFDIGLLYWWRRLK